MPMIAIATPGAVQILTKAESEILALLRNVEDEVGLVTDGFQGLTHHSSEVLTLAAAVVSSIEDESITSILPMVQSLCATAKAFLHERLEATEGVMETVATEAQLLEELSQLTRGQRSIARETQSLSVLTNIEIAHLGEIGSGFQYLARQLGEFSQSVNESTKDLAVHTEERKSSISETKRLLAAGLPRIRQKVSHLQQDLEQILADEESSHAQLSKAPAQFQQCVEEIAGQIASVVGAVQAHDITRQQLEHVQETLRLILERISAAEEGSEDGQEGPLITAGLAIQAYQLRSIQQTVGSWVSQIGICMEGILRISTSDLAGIGPAILSREREIASQIIRIEQLEEECNADNQEVQNAMAGLTSLMQLVEEHLQQSRIVRDSMQLLTFNSIIEANRLGSKADTILEISQSIKRVSAEWSQITDRSEDAKTAILNLVQQDKDEMKLLSFEGDTRLHEAQNEAKIRLQALRKAVVDGSEKIAAVESATAQLRTKIAAISEAKDRLDLSFTTIGALVDVVEKARQHWENGSPDWRRKYDPELVEALFSPYYTMEIEREVLRAALAGAPLPEPQQSLAGNDVELF